MLRVPSNAQELIDQYWRERGGKLAKKSGPRKSDAKVKTSAAQKRRSLIVDEDSDEPPVAKKRGKQSQPVSDDEVVEEPNQKSDSANKASRQKSAAGAPKKSRATAEDEPKEDYVSMKQWKDAPSWAHLVHHIETVERTEDGQLWVYFVLSVHLRSHPLDI